MFAHVDNASDTITSLHILEGLVDAGQSLAMGDEFVDLEFAIHVIGDEAWKLGSTLDTTEGASFPYTTGDELKCCCNVLVGGGRKADLIAKLTSR